MEQKEIDIYEILKGMPDGTPLYTPLCGNVEFTSVAADKENAEAIWTENKNGECSFNKNGKWMNGGEVLLFPSKEMRDWSKFAWKKGDVLQHSEYPLTVIFESFEDDTYTSFKCKYCFDFESASKWLVSNSKCSTKHFYKVSAYEAKEFIKKVELNYNGKLNLETLEIEKPAFEIGKLYVFDEQDEDGNITVIGNLIGKNEGKDVLTFGNQYEIETEKFVVNQAFDLNISLHDELREATENEVELFSKHYSIWQEKEKKAMSKCSFKPFDKVLVRCGKLKWLPAFFIRDIGEDYAARVNALPIHCGQAGFFTSCIPFEGNENLAFTDKDIEDLPF